MPVIRQTRPLERTDIGVAVLAMLMPSASILSFGTNTLLLETRGAILARAGFQVAIVSALADVDCAIRSRLFDLLLLCHTLPAAACQAALSSAAQHISVLRVALTSRFASACPSALLDHEIDVSRGPAHLVATLDALTHAPPPQTLPEEIDMAQYEGQVKWFNNAKGYGFVGRDDGGKDLFTHFSSIQSDGYRTLSEGDRVTFEIVDGEKGLQADQVKLVKKA